MKRIKILLPLIILAWSGLNAQIHLIGISNNGGSGNLDIVKWQAQDPASSVTFPTILEAYLFGSSVFDAYNGNYYLTGISGISSGLFSFNTLTNQQELIPYNNFSNITEIDMSTGKIYNLAMETEGEISVKEYDIETGTNSLLGVISEPGVLGIVADATGFDANHGILYYVGWDTLPSTCLYGISVRNGSFSFTKTRLLPIAPISSFSSVNYDNVNDKLFALNTEYDSMGNFVVIHLVEIDYNSGDVILRGSLEELSGFVAGTSSYDQYSGSFMIVGIDTNFNTRMIVFNTLTNTYETGFVPSGVSEIVCDNSTFAKNTYILTSLEEATKDELAVYPNPATDRITVKQDPASSDDFLIRVYSMNGLLMLEKKYSPASLFDMDIHALPAGVYQLYAEEGSRVHTQKLVIL
jgi:hypothetical protein